MQENALTKMSSQRKTVNCDSKPNVKEEEEANRLDCHLCESLKLYGWLANLLDFGIKIQQSR